MHLRAHMCLHLCVQARVNEHTRVGVCANVRTCSGA